MAKGMRILLLAAAASALTAPTVLATEVPLMRVDVPFGFTVGDLQLPSGEYRIVQRLGSGLVSICSKDLQHQVNLFYVPAPSSRASGAELEFHAHGGRRFLKGIRTAAGFGAYLPDSRAERDAEAAGPVARIGMR